MTSQATNPDYLRKEQYRQPDNLDARAELHRRFSVNKQDLFHWIFEQFQLDDECCILEVGCGPGWLWEKNAERIPSGWEISVCDLSMGMVASAKGKFPSATANVANAQILPFPDDHFDAIIANHMLYHVADKTQAFAEFQRVLKSNGRLYATTIGEQHLGEIHILTARFDEALKAQKWAIDFTLENGADLLKPYFPLVEMRHYEDSLEVSEAEPLAKFVQSTIDMEGEQYIKLVKFIESELEKAGKIHIRKSTGIYIARN